MAKQYQLPREFAEKWVKALRSGEYKQGSNRLWNGVDHYCCIAVGGIICGLTNDNFQDANVLMIDRIGTGNPLQNVSPELFATIPEGIKGPAGLNPMVRELTRLNDVQAASFPEIADWIEQNVEFV